MSALALRGAGALVTPNNVRTAARVLAYATRSAVRNNPRLLFQPIRLGVRGARAMARGLARQARRQTGERRGAETAQRNDELAPAVEDHLIHTLYELPIGLLTRDSGPVPATAPNFRININRRTRGIAYLAGFRLWLHVRNINYNSRLTFRWAIIKNKTIQGVIQEDDFFRSYDEERTRTFGNANNSSLDYATRPINTDKYLILAQGKLRLTPYENVTTSTPPVTQNPRSQQKDSAFIRRYIRLKRQIRFDDFSNELPEDQFFLVHWATTDFLTIRDTGAGLYRTQGDVTTFWREPR